MKKFYLTYQEYDTLGLLQYELKSLCNFLLTKRGSLTADGKRKLFILEGQFNQGDIENLKKYGWRELENDRRKNKCKRLEEKLFKL